jgi:hypothetical protein
MQTELATITPAVAREMLKHNTDNRVLRPSHVETLRVSFERGEFVTTHQGIAFDKSGNLIDGQHRLTAIAMMPETFRVSMLVSRGLDRTKVFPVVDFTQAKRNTSDVLRVDRHLGETANFLARMYQSWSRAGMTATFVAPFVEYIQPEMEELMAFCATASKTWSSSPVRAAAVLRMKIGDADYVKLVYSAMVRKDFDDMPRSAQALFKSYMSGTVRADGSASADLFARCMKVFDPAFSNVQKIQINDAGAAIKQARDMMEEFFRKKKAPTNGADWTAKAQHSTKGRK